MNSSALRGQSCLSALLSVLSVFPLSAQADFRCETRIGYTVELASQKAEAPAATPTADGKNPTPVSATTGAGRETTVYLEVVEARDSDEAKTKFALQKTSARYLEKAREICRERHENVGGCVSSKFEASATTLRSLGFSARKALEDALRSDCEGQKGRCKKVESTEPTCAEIIVPTPTPAAEAKDDKKKKK